MQTHSQMQKACLWILQSIEMDIWIRYFFVFFFKLFHIFFSKTIQDELEEMMAAAVDVQSGEIHYEYYINLLMVCGMVFVYLCIW